MRSDKTHKNDTELLSPLDQELLRLSPTHTGRLRVRMAAVPWSAEEGVYVFDQFGGDVPVSVPLPATLASMPELRIFTLGTKLAFLAQRWSSASIKTWKRMAELGVDTASVCVMARWLVENLDPQQLTAVEKEFQDASEPWRLLTLEGRTLLAVDVGDDGGGELYGALDAEGQFVAWAIDFGRLEHPDWEASPPPPKLVPELLPFAKSELPFALATRRAPGVEFPAVATAMGVSRKQANLGFPRWDGAIIGDLRIKEIEKTDYSFYEQELAALPVKEPHSLFKVFFRYPAKASASKADWAAVLRVMHALGSSCGGVLYQVVGGEVRVLDCEP